MKYRSCLVAVTILLLRLDGLSAQAGRNVEIGTVPGSDQRWALVIGNASYVRIGKLRNPLNDARDMETALEELGFDVDLVLDAGQQQMEDAVRAFGRRLRRGGLGFFYYAGHGVQSDGHNYLIPIGAQIEAEKDLKYKAVDLGFILDEMGEAKNGVNVVVLDACRDNPFRGFRTLSRGLAQTRAPKGTLIAYATSPGEVAADGDGRNGIFTGHLLRSLREPGLQVEQVFKKAREAVDTATGGRQVPWTASSLVGDLVLLKVEAPPPPPTGEALELALWKEVKESEDVAELRAYLDSYPDGVFSGLARLRVRKLESLPPRQPRPGQQWTDPGTGMVLRFIPAGKFMMGSPEDEIDRYKDETRHEVELTQGYWMGETEVTQGQWHEVMKNNPSSFSSCGDECPVEAVSWYDAVTFANRLSEKAGLPTCYELTCDGSPGEEGYICSTVELKSLSCQGYRLPTEAEWERATRAGKGTPFWTGDNLTTDQANYNGNYPYTGNVKGTYRQKPVAVRSFGANIWGLYEIHGNVYEWVWDWFGDYSAKPAVDPMGPPTGSNRVLRGGSWHPNARYCRAADRNAHPPGSRWNDVGFRLLRMGR